MNRGEKLTTTLDEVLKRASELEEGARQLRDTAAVMFVAAGALKQSAAELSVFLEAELYRVYPPVCPKCGAPLVLKQNRQTQGHFWGCSAWKKTKCKGGLDFAQWRSEAARRLLAEES